MAPRSDKSWWLNRLKCWPTCWIIWSKFKRGQFFRRSNKENERLLSTVTRWQHPVNCINNLNAKNECMVRIGPSSIGNFVIRQNASHGFRACKFLLDYSLRCCNLTSRETVRYGDFQAHPSCFYAILQNLILYVSFTMADKEEAIKILICFTVAPKSFK